MEGTVMFANNFSSSAAGPLAIATGAVGLLGLVFIILFFTVGQPFGTLNDICNGLAAVLSAVLAGMLYPKIQSQSPLLSQVTLAIAIFGAILALVGSYLAISGVSGWYLAGLYTVTGYALIGLWLLGLAYLALQDHSLPQGLAIFGLITGLILALGLVAILGIFRGLDDNTYQVTIFNAIWWTSSLAYLTIYPAWCILLGRLLLSGSAGG
jgi:hypothetical protein